MSYTVIVSIPHPRLSPNARSHWAVKAKFVKAARREAFAQAMKAMGRNKPDGWLKAGVKIVAYFKTARHPDPDNMVASLKAVFDGIADSGMIFNDRSLWPDRPEIKKDSKNPRIELTITGEE